MANIFNPYRFAAAGESFIEATGPNGAAGVQDGSTDYKYHTFNGSAVGTNGFSVSTAGTAPNNVVEYLVIAGGGGGGKYYGGGGTGRQRV